MKYTDEQKLRASMIEAIERWWNNSGGIAGAEAVLLPIVGDATLTLMAEAAMGILLAIEDVETYLRDVSKEGG